MGDNMDTKEVKGFLYAWLGRNKFSAPQYEVKTDNRGRISRFKCELRVPGFGYSALGNSTNKKDASTNAAMDFCQFLVREGKMNASEIPKFNSESLDGAKNDFGDMGFGGSGGSMFGGADTGEGGTQNSSSNNSFPAPQGNRLPWNNAYKRDQGTHEQYVAQKAEEIAQSESVDLKAELHGGWTMDNSKAALNEFLQKMRQPAVNYVTQCRESNLVRTFVTEATIFVPQLMRNISGRGQGSNKKVAESGCAMNIVRQMFHLSIMQAYGGPRKKTTASTLPEIPVSLPDDLIQRVREYVKKCGVEPIVADQTSASADSPTSLLTDQKLLQFPDSEIAPPANVSWAPPMQNWNPWRASNIDEPPLAFMTMQQISERITEKENVKHEDSKMQKMLNSRGELPVSQFRQQIVETVAKNRVTLIKGETGCGKSTQVAQFLLESYIEEGRGAEFNAVVSQPRRISAISLAERVANERGEPLGETVGYSVRFDGVSPRPYGSILFCTVGVLLRRMENGLRGISHVIIDEIHERDVDTDFVLIVLREMISEYSNLRVVLMSATIDTELFTNFFGTCPVITMHGRTFPVQHFFLEDIISNLRYMPEEPDKKKKRGADDEEGDEETDDKGKNLNVADDDAHPQLKMALSRLSEKEIPYGVIEAILKDIANRGAEGAVLIFLPGWAEIVSLMNFLNEHQEFSQTSKYEVLPLHSQLTSVEQRRVFDHFEGKRKIILSTNIAETSITIDDVVFVIDSCKAKERMYTSNNNMVHFATVWASRTNIVQRRGRAGRVRAGYAFHLCSKKRFNALDEHGTAEMLRIPLHQIALTIKLLRLGSVGEFLGKALEPPPYDMVVESEAVLQSMGALDKNLELTSLGRMLARLPIEPVVAKVIVLGTALGLGAVMCDVAAAMSFSTPFVPRERHHTRLSGIQRSFSGNKHSDHIALVAVTQSYRETAEQSSYSAEREFCERYSLSHPILKMTCGARRQLIDVLRNSCGFPEEMLYDIRVNVNGKDSELDLMRSLLVMALYPNVCFFRGKRKVYTIEQASALVTKYSVLTPFNNSTEMNLPSPLLVFTEKVRTRCISCKELSTISAIQLLLFGSRKVECIGADLVRLDDMITIKLPVDQAAQIVALRPCIDALIIRTCETPESLACANPDDSELRMLLRDLSSEEWMENAGPIKDGLLTDAAQNQRAGGHMRPSRGAGAHNSWGFGGGSNGPSCFNNSGFNTSTDDEQNSPGGGKMTSPRNVNRGGHPYSMNRGGGYGGGDNGQGDRGGWRGGSRGGFRGGYGGRGGGGGYGDGGGGYGGGYGGGRPRGGGGFRGRGRGGGNWNSNNW